MAFLITLSAVFSGSETALFSLTPLKRRQMALARRRVDRIESLLIRPEQTLSTLLLSNTLVNIWFTGLFTTMVLGLIQPPLGEWLSLLGGTIVLLALGEITPKAFSNRHAERVALIVSGPLVVLLRLLAPAIATLNALPAIVFGLLPHAHGQEQTLNTDFISQVVNEGSSEGALPPEAGAGMMATAAFFAPLIFISPRSGF
jgi:putative hemolysin